MYKILVSALFATAAIAQIPGLPPCSQGCITNYGGCNQVDVKCICNNKPLIDNLACCVGKCCEEADIKKVIQFADALCAGQGVTDLPTAATCAAGAVTTGFTCAAGTPTASGSSASATGSGSSAAASASSASASASSVASSASSAAAQSTGAANIYQPEGVGLGMAILGFLAAL